MGEYISTGSAAAAIGITLQGLLKKLHSGEIRCEAMQGSRGGAGGITYRIPLDALPVEAQVRYWMSRDSTEAGDADIAGYRERYGEEGLRELLKSQAAAREVIGRLSGMLRGRGAVYEEAAKRYGVSTRTIRRWESAYREKGLKGLMKPLERADKGESRTICAWAGDFLKHMYVGGQVGGIGGGNAKICQQSALVRLQEEAERLGDSACDMCPYCEGSERREEMSREERKDFPACKDARGRMIVPKNRYAVNRYMAQVPEQVKDFGRYGDRYWAAHHMQKARRDKPTRVNECWFGDHHKIDIFVMDERGALVRPWLTAWSDACSGVLVGWMLTLEPNGDTIAESFCRAAAYTRGSEIHGLPEAIYVDNGKDYRSARFERGKLMDRELGKLNARFDPDGEESGTERTMLEMLGVAMIRAKPYQGWSKTIERIFGIIEKQHWIRELPGWCGDSPEERPQNLGIELTRLQKDGKLLTFAQFAEIWATRILPAYHAYASSEDKRSPMEIYRDAPRAPTATPSWETLALMKSQAVQRKVETTGIRFQNTRYWDEALADYIGKYVTVRYNRGYCESVTVMHERHFVCEAEVAENLKLIEPDSERVAEHMKAQARQRAKVTGEIKRLKQSVKGMKTRAAYVEEIDEQRDMAEATLVSTEGRRAAQAKAEAAQRRAGKKKAADAGAGAVVSMLERRGAALAEKDAAEW